MFYLGLYLCFNICTIYMTKHMKKHKVNPKNIKYSPYLKNYIKKTNKYLKKGTLKRVWLDLKDLTPIKEKRERCPNGTQKNRKTKKCEAKENRLTKTKCPKGTRKNRKTKECEAKENQTTRKRCPNGTRKNRKTKECVSKAK
jgi:hypothetical protein